MTESKLHLVSMERTARKGFLPIPEEWKTSDNLRLATNVNPVDFPPHFFGPPPAEMPT